MLISLRTKSYEDLKKELKKEDKIVLWSCDTCIRFSGLGGIDNLQKLEDMLIADGYDVIKKELLGVSCVDEAIEDRKLDDDKREIFNAATVIVVLACDEAWEKVDHIFENIKVIRVTKSFGFGNISKERGILLTNPFEDIDVEAKTEGIPIEEVAKQSNTYSTFFDADIEGREPKLEKVSLTIDGRKIEAKKGANLLEVCEENDIHIPHLCYRKGLSASGACRLCLVKIKDRKGLIASCSTHAEEGMEVTTQDEEIVEYRRFTLELLLSAHEHNCLYCVKDGCCEFRDAVKEYKVDQPRFEASCEPVPVDHSSDAITRDVNKCILCGRCVRACDEIAGKHNLTFAKRGNQTELTAGLDKPMGDSDCITCMACVYACPTGALYENMLYFDGEDFKPRKLYGSYYQDSNIPHLADKKKK